MCYLSVNPRSNAIYLNKWSTVEGKRTRQSLPLKTYSEPGRAQEVLRKARQRGLRTDVVVERLVGTKRADWLLNGNGGVK